LKKSKEKILLNYLIMQSDENLNWPRLMSISEKLKKPPERHGIPLIYYKPNSPISGEENYKEYKQVLSRLEILSNVFISSF
jgi:hypothetical protein